MFNCGDIVQASNKTGIWSVEGKIIEISENKTRTKGKELFFKLGDLKIIKQAKVNMLKDVDFLFVNFKSWHIKLIMQHEETLLI